MRTRGLSTRRARKSEIEREIGMRGLKMGVQLGAVGQSSWLADRA